MDNMDNMDNDYFEMSLEEKKNLKNEIKHDLQQLVIDICSQWDDMASTVDYNEFGNYVQECLEKAMKQLNCPYICGHVWGAH